MEQMTRFVRQRKRTLELYQAEEEANRLLEYIQERTGLLNEEGTDRCAFVHKTFQEYLTAQEIQYRERNQDFDDLENYKPEITNHIRQYLEAVVNGLLALLEDSEYWVRFCAAEALSKVGNSSEKIVTGLLALLKDTNTDVCDSAGEALIKLGHASKDVVNGLLALLTDTESGVRSSAAAALGDLGNGSEMIVMALLALLNNTESFVCHRAATALGNLGKIQKGVATDLLQWPEQNPEGKGVTDAMGALWGLVMGEE